MNQVTRKLLNLPDPDDETYRHPPFNCRCLGKTGPHTCYEDDAQFDSANEPEANTPQEPSISDIIRQETDHGRTVVRFLISTMNGELEHSKACHQLDAARQLIKFGFDAAQSFLDSQRRVIGTSPALRAPGADDERQELHPELTRIIREETDDGRATVRFLIDVMLGNRAEFKPHHRINAAKELLRLGFPTEQASQPKPKQKPEQPTHPRDIIIYKSAHNPRCDCRSGLADCVGIPSEDVREPDNARGAIEQEALFKAYPDYVPPTDEELRRIVREGIPLQTIAFPHYSKVARELFKRDIQEKANPPDP